MTVVRVADDYVQLGELLALLLDDDAEVRISRPPWEDLLTPAPWAGVDVAVLDLSLDSVSGADVLAYLAEHFPTVRRILWTGSALDDPVVTERAAGLAHRVIYKGDPVDWRAAVLDA